MSLTEVAVRNAKPQAKTVKLSDAGGLQLWVMPNGSKLWNVAYRFGGLQRKLALGKYPLVTLREAREGRDAAKRQLADGRDPMAAKKTARSAKRAADETTFSIIADELLRKRKEEGLSDVTLDKKRWLLGFAKPSLGERPIGSISAAEVLSVLRSVEKTGMRESARRLRSVMSEVFRYGIATTRGETDPTIALRGALIAPTVKSRAAITTAKAFGGLLRAIDGFEGQSATKAALKLMALLFPRPGELRLSQWREYDLKQAIWTIPAHRAKMRREHSIPLSRQAIQILEELRTESRPSELVFASVHSNRRPLSENTLNGALRRLGFGPDEATAHGFRASASTLLNESGLWSADAVERALAHVERDETRRAYARGKYWDERVRMAQWWADYLDDLRHSERDVRP
jgi:integrase